MNILLNANHELRSGWKFAAYVTFFFLFLVATRIAFSFFGDVDLPENSLAFLFVNEGVLCVPTIGALLLSLRFVDHRPPQTFGIGFLPQWQRDLGKGLGLGAVMVAFLLLGCFTLGYVRIGWTATQVPASTLIGTLTLLLLAAANEELIFRGFPLQVLIEAIGTWPAIIALSILFGLAHSGNPNASLLGMANTILAGVLLSVAYVKRRSLWLPYGIHIGWNVGLGFVLGVPLSGVDIASLWTTGIAGRDTILGGDYGPEGGLLATFIFAASAVIVQRSKSR
jgi:hypothetical protein